MGPVEPWKYPFSISSVPWATKHCCLLKFGAARHGPELLEEKGWVRLKIQGNVIDTTLNKMAMPMPSSFVVFMANRTCKWKTMSWNVLNMNETTIIEAKIDWVDDCTSPSLQNNRVKNRIVMTFPRTDGRHMYIYIFEHTSCQLTVQL